MTDPTDPLGPLLAAWRDDLADVAFTSAFMEADGSAACVADLAGLIARDPARALADPGPRIDALIAAGADASAALALVEPLGSFMLSGGPGGRRMATVVLTGRTQEHHAEGATVALALCGALASALAGLEAPRTDLPAGDDIRGTHRLN